MALSVHVCHGRIRKNVAKGCYCKPKIRPHYLKTLKVEVIYNHPYDAHHARGNSGVKCDPRQPGRAQERAHHCKGFDIAGAEPAQSERNDEHGDTQRKSEQTQNERVGAVRRVD